MVFFRLENTEFPHPPYKLMSELFTYPQLIRALPGATICRIAISFGETDNGINC